MVSAKSVGVKDFALFTFCVGEVVPTGEEGGSVEMKGECA